MKPKLATLGICRSAACLAAGNPVERYAGPGRFCPSCGEWLQPYVPGKSAWSLPESPSPNPEEPTPSAATPPKPREALIGASFFRSHPHAGRAALVIVIGAIVTFAILRTTAMGNSAGRGTVGVCGSSMTERVARDLLHDYGARNAALAEHFELRTTNCGVQFSVVLRRHPRGFAADPRSAVHKVMPSESTIGRDGVVAIVNPQNRVGKMSAEELRKIVAGDLANWTSLGGRSAPIVVYLPADSTDEARVIAVALMKGAAVGTSVVRVPTSADVVRAVVAANGTDAIGIVAFSAAVPGKIVTLHEFPVPSVLSIGDWGYPLSVAVTVASAEVARDPIVSGLLSYAGSGDAKAVAQRAGIITEGVSR